MDATVAVEGKELKLTNLDKVLYPSGFTKAEVIDYYTRIAPVMLPHLAGRNLTLVRFPNGTEAGSFFAKNVPSHAPSWIERVGIKDNNYIVCRDVPTLVFMANLAGLEVHVPMHRAADDSWTPDAIVFDLDPGPGCDVRDCAQVAVMIREVLDRLNMPLVAKTSGSKGMQLHARPMPGTPYDDGEGGGTTAFALALAEGLERAHPDRVVSKMTKTLRPGKVLIDWSQNVRGKTTICAYSLRAREQPTVSTPLTWHEVERCAGGEEMRFTAAEVLERVRRQGDLFRWPDGSPA